MIYIRFSLVQQPYTMLVLYYGCVRGARYQCYCVILFLSFIRRKI